MDNNPTTTPPTNPEPSALLAAVEQQPTVPATWPGGFGLYKYSRNAVRLNAGSIVGLILIDLAIAIFLTVFLHKSAPFAERVISFLISSLFNGAYVSLTLAGANGQKMSFGESVQKALKLYLKYLGLSIITIIATTLSFLALLIPFFFVFPRLVLAPYFLFDQNMRVLEAFNASWQQTKGNVGKVYGIIGATWAMGLLLFTIVGIPVALYLLFMYSAATAILYRYITSRQATPSTPIQPSAVPASPSQQ